MSKQKLLVWDPVQKRWVPQRRTSGGGGGGGGGYSEVIVDGTTLTSDAGDPLTIAADPPIQVTGDADTDTVTIGIRMGPGSNLDADTVDGKHAADFALASHSHPNATATSAGFMSAADKAKLDGIQSGAEANQLAYSVVKVGSTSVAAQSTTDTLELEAGSNIALTPDAVARKVAVAVSPQGHTSGLNADLLDGQHASAFAPVTHTHTPAQISPQGHGSGLDADMLDGNHASAFALASHTHPDATTTTSGFMSAADKVKLDGIEAGAEVNQNAFSQVKVGSSIIAADSKTDVLELAAGNNIALIADETNDKVTIAVSPQGDGSGLDADLLDGQHASAFALASHSHPNATPSADGFMSAGDKAKLDGIEAGAQVNQNAFSRVIVGSTNIDAGSITDALRLIAGANITLTPDAGTKSITIAASGGGGGGGGSGYGTISAGSATLTADPGDTLTIQGANPITVSGDAATDTVTIGIEMGHGSGLNADLLDGLHASAFAPASHEHSLPVQLGVNTSAVIINSTNPTTVASVTLTEGRWLLIAMSHVVTLSSTTAMCTVSIRSGTTALAWLGFNFSSSNGPRTYVIPTFRTVTSSETLNLAAATSNTSVTFTVPNYCGYLLAIRCDP
jgi:outer membrane protein assembly factor BamE (lipoprotein component of BamABCDE complex)